MRMVRIVFDFEKPTQQFECIEWTSKMHFEVNDSCKPYTKDPLNLTKTKRYFKTILQIFFTKHGPTCVEFEDGRISLLCFNIGSFPWCFNRNIDFLSAFSRDHICCTKNRISFPSSQLFPPLAESRYVIPLGRALRVNCIWQLLSGRKLGAKY